MMEANGTIHITPHLHEMIAPFLAMWDLFPMGVMITDKQGDVVYYNEAQSMIDGLSVKYALGKNVRFLYGPDPGPSLVISCLQSGKPIINYVCVYRTVKGNAINSAHWVYPLFKGNTLLGCVCFVQQFDKLAEVPAASNLEDLPTDNCGKISFTNLVSKNPLMLKAIYTAKLGAGTPSPVLLFGDTGTGKDVFARNIHGSSLHRNNAYVALNCAAIPENLLESLLFGTTKGAFTGAMDKQGLFEQANGGTLFLDEMDSMPLPLQAKLLRVLQDKKVRRMGSEKEIQLSLKIISATSQDPMEAVNSGRLRPDLFYRLGVIVIGIPPLRNRLEDLEDLCTFFILKHNTLLGKKVKALSPRLLDMFCSYHWPGNVRELEHVIEAAMSVTRDQEYLEPEMVPDYFLRNITEDNMNACPPLKNQVKEVSDYPSNNLLQPFPTPEQPLSFPDKQNEKDVIIKTLTMTYGNVTMAARILKVSRQNLSYKLKKHGLNRKDFRLDT